MSLTQRLQPLFSLLESQIRQLSPEQFRQPCSRLNGSSVGQHVRHILEMFQCLEKGYDAGIVNYELRSRDTRIEQEIGFALDLMEAISNAVDRPDKSLLLIGEHGYGEQDELRLSTFYSREVLYNMEHAIHHMAMIRVGLEEQGIQDIPSHFGVAPSTVKHSESCAR